MADAAPPTAHGRALPRRAVLVWRVRVRALGDLPHGPHALAPAAAEAGQGRGAGDAAVQLRGPADAGARRRLPGRAAPLWRRAVQGGGLAVRPARRRRREAAPHAPHACAWSPAAPAAARRRAPRAQALHLEGRRVPGPLDRLPASAGADGARGAGRGGGAGALRAPLQPPQRRHRGRRARGRRRAGRQGRERVGRARRRLQAREELGLRRGGRAAAHLLCAAAVHGRAGV